MLLVPKSALWLFGSIIALASIGSPSGAHAEETIGKVTQLKGQAWESSGATPTELKEGSPVHAGLAIYTTANSRAILTLGQHDSAVMIKADSRITLRQTASHDWVAELDQGGALFRIKNPEHRPNHFNVRSRTVVMGARGTTFFVEDAKAQPLFFCDCTGKVAVTEPGATEQVFTSKHHDHPTDIASGTTPLAERVTPSKRTADHIDHSDADIAELDHAIDL